MHHLWDAGVRISSIGKLHFRSTDDDNGFGVEILPMHVVGGVGWPLGLLRETAPDYAGAAELARDVGTGQSTHTACHRAIVDAANRWLRDGAWQNAPCAAFVSFVSPR